MDCTDFSWINVELLRKCCLEERKAFKTAAQIYFAINQVLLQFTHGQCIHLIANVQVYTQLVIYSAYYVRLTLRDILIT